jgi:hypothetical protein
VRTSVICYYRKATLKIQWFKTMIYSSLQFWNCL